MESGQQRGCYITAHLHRQEPVAGNQRKATWRQTGRWVKTLARARVQVLACLSLALACWAHFSVSLGFSVL